VCSSDLLVRCGDLRDVGASVQQSVYLHLADGEDRGHGWQTDRRCHVDRAVFGQKLEILRTGDEAVHASVDESFCDLPRWVWCSRFLFNPS